MNDSIAHIIRVTWQHRVLFTEQVFSAANPRLREVLAGEAAAQPARTLVVVDQTLAAAQPALAPSITAYFDYHRDALRLVAAPLICPGGERAKSSWTNVAELHAAINRHHIDRHSFLVAIGGGGLLDLAGLAAATAHRGVRHVRLPSTTLSQCDSGVGVKNGINAFGKKNFIGTFAPPVAVINDFALLATLQPPDLRAGFAEAVKVACIKDAAFFQSLEINAGRLREFAPDALRRLVRRCAELHLEHIATNGDPFEFGAARPLDFGHWSAHKLEQMSDFNLRHGEAVAIGMALDVVYARRQGLLAPENAERVLQLLENLGFTLFTPELARTAPSGDLVVLEGLEEFREHLGGELAVTLPPAIGSKMEVHEMNAGCLLDSIHELQERYRCRQGRGTGAGP